MTVTAMPKQEAPAGAAAPADPPKSKKKLLIIIVAVLALGGGGWYMFLKPPAPEGPPVPGDVVTMEPIQLNLAGGHYLRIGIALQAVAGAGAHGPLDGSKALDAVIDQFSGRTIAEVNDPKKRAQMKEALVSEMDELYHHEVMDVYFTEFVTQ